MGLLALLVLMYLALRSLRLLAGFYGGQVPPLVVDNSSGMFVAGYAGLMHLLLCSSVVVRAKILGILVGINLKDSFMRQQLCISHCFQPVCRQAYDARHHGRYGREGHLCGILVMMQTPTTPWSRLFSGSWRPPQLLSDKVVDVLVVPWTLFLRALVSGSLLFC